MSDDEIARRYKQAVDRINRMTDREMDAILRDQARRRSGMLPRDAISPPCDDQP